MLSDVLVRRLTFVRVVVKLRGPQDKLPYLIVVIAYTHCLILIVGSYEMFDEVDCVFIVVRFYSSGNSGDEPAVRDGSVMGHQLLWVCVVVWLGLAHGGQVLVVALTLPRNGTRDGHGLVSVRMLENEKKYM